MAKEIDINVAHQSLTPVCPDSEGEVRTGRKEALPPLSEVRQIKDVSTHTYITEINGVPLRQLDAGMSFVLQSARQT